MGAREELLRELDRSVAEAADFLRRVDGDFYDGQQTAREVLSHLVFWHREYVRIAAALVNGRSPHLRQSTFARLNARAAREFRRDSMASLCRYWLTLHKLLRSHLRRLPDWSVDFPVKRGCRRADVAERVQQIQEHVDGHLARLENAQRRGEAWVAAYYPARSQARPHGN